jgi:uncharacterized membrane protein
LSSPPVITKNLHVWAIRLNRLVYWLSRHWLLIISVLLGLYVGLPWLAPIFMTLGWTSAAKTIYLFYSTQCHQLPQRSFFLFGPELMYSLDVIQTAWQDTSNPAILRQFTGNPDMGWKVAWSDRMVYMYASTLLWGILFWPLRKRVKSLPWRGLTLLLLPMFVDGLTHMISDVTGGIGGGFRDTNAWLAALTTRTFPATFYAGDALGSFNSWIRLVTGVLFGLGVVWFAYPLLQREFASTARQIAAKFQKAGLEL